MSNPSSLLSRLVVAVVMTCSMAAPAAVGTRRPAAVEIWKRLVVSEYRKK